MWPALRVRPKPTFIRASPAAARGTIQMKKRQAMVVTSGSLGTGIGIRLYPLAQSDATEKREIIPTLPRPCRSGRKRHEATPPEKGQSLPEPITIPPAATRNPWPSSGNSLSIQRAWFRQIRCTLKYHTRHGTPRAAPTKRMGLPCVVLSPKRIAPAMEKMRLNLCVLALENLWIESRK